MPSTYAIIWSWARRSTAEELRAFICSFEHDTWASVLVQLPHLKVAEICLAGDVLVAARTILQDLERGDEVTPWL